MRTEMACSIFPRGVYCSRLVWPPVRLQVEVRSSNHRPCGGRKICENLDRSVLVVVPVALAVDSTFGVLGGERIGRVVNKTCSEHRDVDHANRKRETKS